MATWALKEWAVACEALAAGRQTLLVRKGGIDEKLFDLPARSFLLLPTYVHQQEHLLKPDAVDNWRRILAAHDPEAPTELALWAELGHVWTVWDDSALAALSRYHLWSDDYARERLKWRPRHPLHLLLLRTYRLARPVAVPPEVELGGCRSWLELPVEVDLAGRQPLFDDHTLDAWRNDIEAAAAPFGEAVVAVDA